MFHGQPNAYLTTHYTIPPVLYRPPLALWWNVVYITLMKTTKEPSSKHENRDQYGRYCPVGELRIKGTQRPVGEVIDWQRYGFLLPGKEGPK